MTLFIRLTFDYLHIGMMVFLCMTLFGVKLNRNNKKLVIASTGIIFLLMSFKSYIQLDYTLAARLIEVLLLIIMAVFIKKLIRQKYLIALSASFFSVVVSIPVYILVTFLWLNTKETDVNFRLIEMATAISLSLFYCTLLMVLNNKKLAKAKRTLSTLIIKFKNGFIGVFILMYGALIVSDIISNNRYLSKNLLIILTPVFMLLTFASLIFLIGQLQKNQQHIEDQLALLDDYTDTIDLLYQDVKNYKIELTKEFNYIQECADINDQVALKKYYDTHLNENELPELEVYQILIKLSKLKISSLKGLILSKYQKALNVGVLFDAGIIDELDDLEVDEIDLCRMLGILLDNAIEAAKDSPAKSTHVFIENSISQPNRWSIQVKNNYSGKLDHKRGRWRSTKGKKRGVGLKSLTALITKYTHIKLETHVSKDFIVQNMIIDKGEVR